MSAEAEPLPLPRTLRTPAELVAAGVARAEHMTGLDAVAARYAIAISPAMAALIDPRDPVDPIALQFVPSSAELQNLPDERADPIGDHPHSPVPGLVHRYRDRVLLKVTGVCPVYCRFCFRREMVGPQTGFTPDERELEAALAYIRAHPEIWEVIFTGGDPLMVSPRRIESLSTALASIPHVRVVRWHSRVPIVAPDKITTEVTKALTRSGLATVIGVHVNHPREFTPAARAALARLNSAGLMLVSQSVLLRGVNDDVETLEALMRACVEARISPYYLHHGDLAPGTAHFRVPIARGQALVRALEQRLSGIARPDYVIDIPGGFGKISLLSAAVTPAGHGAYILTDRDGRQHSYRDICAPDAQA